MTRAASPAPTFPPAPHTLTSLAGLRAAGVPAGIKASGAPDVAVLVADRPIAAAGVFTQNRLAAAPVELSRAHLRATGGRVRAVVVNSGNANACTGDQGRADAAAMAAQVASAIGCAREEVLVASTGVIGVPLPMQRVRAGIDAALAELSNDVEAGRRFLEAIRTTDAFAKEASARLATPAGEATIAGVCKGAGMIEPDMATMLAFVATDLALSAAELERAIGDVARASFNAVHVDTHASTNDTFLLLATGALPAPSGWIADARRVAERLAWLIARDGEGATKVTRVEVRGAADDAAARAIARRVAASALVRTALFGNDPNWGRFTSAVGNAPEVRDIAPLRCVLQGIVVYEKGAPTAFDRAAASKAMATEDVRLELELADGPGVACLLTSDLGYRYVEINAEYTT